MRSCSQSVLNSDLEAVVRPPWMTATSAISSTETRVGLVVCGPAAFGKVERDSCRL